MEEKLQRLDVGFNGRRAWCQKRKRQDGNCLGTYVAFFFFSSWESIRFWDATVAVPKGHDG